MAFFQHFAVHSQTHVDNLNKNHVQKLGMIIGSSYNNMTAA